MKYILQEKKSGNKIAQFNSKIEATAMLLNYEARDRAKGIYVPGSYEIIEIDE